MKKTLLGLGIISALAMAAPASANDVKINPWKHCGIGATIFDDNPTAAAVSNVIWDLGTTAVTSNTASEDSCASQEIAAAQFIEDNLEQLSTELAAGEGHAVQAFVELTNAEVTTLRTALLDNIDASRNEQAQAIYFAAQ
ncbi:DUF3015 family protein [Opacimonas viscosa]|uniref:DUF3015 domain-containing protein n=1 Tax=Opacimonas viscosa TaxID=2961944 RepID=A0AA42BM19_9ALTE|nr:DUF3015 family protein [Opacimonas viscosa]MCP3429189.1 DUF3015 domain-containing protein [Opacimonas viscosa]